MRECKVSLVPAMGSLKLRRFVPPWGKIYFVLEEPFQWAVPGGETRLTAFISARSAEKPQPEKTRDGRGVTGKDVLPCVAMAVVGLTFSAVAAILSPN